MADETFVTAADHFAEAEGLLDAASNLPTAVGYTPVAANIIGAAQVHATLAQLEWQRSALPDAERILREATGLEQECQQLRAAVVGAEAARRELAAALTDIEAKLRRELDEANGRASALRATLGEALEDLVGALAELPATPGREWREKAERWRAVLDGTALVGDEPEPANG